MARTKKSYKCTQCRIESSSGETMTVSMPRAAKTYKQGDMVIVTVSSKRASAFRRHRKVSEIIAQGPVKNISKDEIVIATAHSPIVSKEAQTKAITQKHPVVVKIMY